MGTSVQRNSEMPHKVPNSTDVAGHIFVDFDGTIAIDDTTLLLLERFAGPSWRLIEERWEAGEIGSRDCLSQQIELLRALPEEIDAALDGVTVDSTFSDLVGFASQNHMNVTVISDGLDRSVTQILGRMHTDLPVFANTLEWLGKDRWRVHFPNWHHECRSISGHCKCATVSSSKANFRVLIGDGRSDFCAAETVDLVFAKGRLANYCEQNALPYYAFTDFAQSMDVILNHIDEASLVEG